MTTNMYSVVESDSPRLGLVVSFTDKFRATCHCNQLNKSHPDKYIVVPSEVTLYLPVT